MTYGMYQSHTCKASNPGDIEKSVHSYEIRRKVKNSLDKPRLMIQEARVELSSEAAAIVP